MTFDRLPADPRELLALLGPDALMAHIEACVAHLSSHGVEVTPDARRGLDELAECVIEHHARHDPAALARHLAALDGDAATHRAAEALQ